MIKIQLKIVFKVNLIILNTLKTLISQKMLLINWANINYRYLIYKIKKLYNNP